MSAVSQAPEPGRHSPLTALRLQLHRNGYRPVPVTDPDFQHPKLKSPGKAPFIADWQSVCASATEADIIGWETGIRRHNNTGLLCGDMVGVDLDLPVPALAESIGQLAEEMLGATPLHRVGKAPKLLRCYRAERPMQKMETPELLLDDGTVLQVEVMGQGQQVVSYGTHPATLQPYSWPEYGPDLVPLSELPVATEARLRAFLAAAEKVIRDAGGRTKKERERDAEEAVRADADSPDDPFGGSAAPRQGSGDATGKNDFFLAVNKAALGNVRSWFLALFPKAREEKNTGCWRVSSEDLGRGLEEDISMHPVNGGRDFGTEKSCSPIDLVIEWGGAPDSVAAAHYLCERMGVDPGTLGWKPKRQKEKAPSERSDIVWGQPVDFLADNTHGTPTLQPHHVPQALWPFITDVSRRMGVDPACVALVALVSCASVISDEWRVQPKQNDYTWTEQPRLWGAVVGAPSIMKTPIISACTKPIDKMEIDARKRHQDEMRVWRNDCEIAKLDKQPPPSQPKLDRYMVEGTTIEALSEVLRDDDEAKMRSPQKKTLCRQDEMSEFFGSLDRYKSGGKGGGDRGAYLRLFNGGRYTIDRIGRGSFAIEHWSACFVGGVQPGPIQRIARDAADDGLLQRFMYAVPDYQDEGVDERPDAAAMERYSTLFPALARMRPAPPLPGAPIQSIVLAAGAHDHRIRINALCATMTMMPDVSKRLEASFGKWPGLFARLCLTFHMIEIADARRDGAMGPPIQVISEATASRVAAYLQDIVLPHLLRAEAVMFSTDQTGHARWIAGYILAHKLERVATRDVTRAYRPFKSPEAQREMTAVMASLVALAWLEPEEPSNPVKPVSSWLVNPAVHTAFAEHARQEDERRARARQQIADVTATLRADRRPS